MNEKRFCPKCKSEDVKLQQSTAYGSAGHWVCNKCGYYNVIFPIKEEIGEKKK